MVKYNININNVQELGNKTGKIDSINTVYTNIIRYVNSVIRQVHSGNLNTWNLRGSPDFTSFNPTLILAGDNWRCDTPGAGVTVNNVAGNVVLYQGDIVLALIDNPGDLNHVNVNAGKWEIMRKHPIGLGTKKSYVHGGYLFEASIDNDYHYLCVQAGIPETLNGSGDGTAIWKKSPLHLSQ